MRVTRLSPSDTSLRPAKLLAKAPTMSRDGQREQHAKAGNVKAQQPIRVPGPGQDGQRLIERAHYPGQHPGGDDAGHDDQQAREQPFAQCSHEDVQPYASELAGAFAGAALTASFRSIRVAGAAAAVPPAPPRKSVTYQPEPFELKAGGRQLLGEGLAPQAGSRSGAHRHLCSTSWHGHRCRIGRRK